MNLKSDDEPLCFLSLTQLIAIVLSIAFIILLVFGYKEAANAYIAVEKSLEEKPGTPSKTMHVHHSRKIGEPRL